MTFRIGVIGAGSHGQRYLRHAAADVPGMGVAALCRRDAAAGRPLADGLGVRYHADPAALVADPQVDGVVVCTPPSSHFALAAAVLAAGKPLLLEKPLTGTLDEAARLAALDAAAPHPLMLAQSLRWNPVIARVRELWPLLGPVHLVRLAQRLAPTALAWQRDPATSVGGSVLLTGVHLFDTVRHLTGREFTEIDSRHRQVLNPAVEDLFLARGRLDDGCWVDLEVSKYTRSRACWLEAVGEDGQLWADYLLGGVVLRRGKDEELHDVSATAPTLPPLLAAWLAAVQRGTLPPCGAADGLATLTVVDACYRSARADRAMAV
ncbi:MAG: Gfo/Idh/MocA family oxidoreductase [Krumholzibacteria bacterium]|nr:Gfo/Idh/MocA family oxidoreductase [Candidatus Krumholzibacteria bacterium]